MGLCVLEDIDKILEKRKVVYEVYFKELSNFVELQAINSNCSQNYAYFAILLESEKQALKVQKALNDNNIFPRRYFHPSLDTLPYVENQMMQTSRDISSRILCLPMFEDLKLYDQMQIINIVKENIRG